MSSLILLSIGESSCCCFRSAKKGGGKKAWETKGKKRVPFRFGKKKKKKKKHVYLFQRRLGREPEQGPAAETQPAEPVPGVPGVLGDGGPAAGAAQGGALSCFFVFFVFFLAKGHSEKKEGIAVFRDSLRQAPLEQQRPSTPTCERAESVPGLRCPLRGLPGHGREPRCESERALLLLTLL